MTGKKILCFVGFIFSTLLLSGCSDEDASTDTASPTPTSSSDMPASEPAIGTPIADLAPPSSTNPAAESPTDSDAQTVPEFEWDSLIPDDYQPEKILAKYDLDNLTDDDPRAAELEQELKALWDDAPVKPELDGLTVRIPGFVVPVETDAEETTGFLLVPYYGACIHVPPPPANQTIYVVTEKGKGTKPKTFDVVWVTGNISVQRIENDVAEAGYTIYANDVSPYE